MLLVLMSLMSSLEFVDVVFVYVDAAGFDVAEFDVTDVN